MLAIVLTFGSIATVVHLQRREASAHSAELRLAILDNQLSALQSAPFKANASTGGSPTLAHGLIQSGKAQIAGILGRLERQDPPRALSELRVPLAANYQALDQIYTIGSSSVGYGPEADRLAGIAAQSDAAASRLLADASRSYRTRAQRASNEAAIGGALASLLLLAAFGFTYRQNRRLLATATDESLTDALTGLPNRRAFQLDLVDRLRRATTTRPLLLALFDLDGFKQYNDTFGHPAGDALLARLGDRLRAHTVAPSTTYRLGGDEFCLLAPTRPGVDSSEIEASIASALTETNRAFTIACSHGSALLPVDAATAEEGLRLADQRMYTQKTNTASAGRQSSDVLLKVLSERSRSLQTHVSNVGRLAQLLAERLHLSPTEQEQIRLAAELHDIGKTAIPDSILNKPGELTSDEWAYMHRHTVIGERIILAAPALSRTASIVRSSHERIDGNGYPDRLQDDAIPIGSRIIAVCDAFDAMTSDRPYRRARPLADALAELRRNAGTQFDAHIVDEFEQLTTQLSSTELPRAA